MRPIYSDAAERRRSATGADKVAIVCALALIAVLFGELLNGGGGGLLQASEGSAAALAVVAIFAVALPAVLALTPNPLELRLPAICFGALLLKCILSAAPIYPDAITAGWPLRPAEGTLSLAPWLTVLDFYKLASLGAVFYLGWMVGRSARARRICLRGLMVSSAVYALVAVVQHALHPTLDMLGHEKVVHLGRIVASLDNANAAAVAFGIFECILFTKFIERFEKSQQSFIDFGHWLDSVVRNCAWPLAAMMIVGVALAETGSRGGLASTSLGLLVVLGAYIFKKPRRNPRDQDRSWIGLALVGGIVVLALAAAEAEGFSDRAHEFGDEPNRLQLLQIYLTAALRAPLTGYGQGVFPVVNNHLTNVSNFKLIGDLNAPHNLFLLWLIEGGIGFTLIISLLVGIIIYRVVWVVVNLRRNESFGCLISCVAASCVLAVNNAFDFAAEFLSLSALWLGLCGMAYAAAYTKVR